MHPGLRGLARQGIRWRARPVARSLLRPFLGRPRTRWRCSDSNAEYPANIPHPGRPPARFRRAGNDGVAPAVGFRSQARSLSRVLPIPPPRTNSGVSRRSPSRPVAPAARATSRHYQEKLASSMRAAWANFAASGDPSTAAVPWPSFSPPVLGGGARHSRAEAEKRVRARWTIRRDERGRSRRGIARREGRYLPASIRAEPSSGLPQESRPDRCRLGRAVSGPLWTGSMKRFR
jgi:hypothetical protein